MEKLPPDRYTEKKKRKSGILVMPKDPYITKQSLDKNSN
jgi:hypothetical protein